MASAERRAETFAFPGVGRLDAAAVATWAFGAALVVYLLLAQGGYDPIVRNEVGIAVWAIAICGVLCGAFKPPWATRGGAILLALLTAYTVWTALSLGWTGSKEQTATELARVATYLGILVLGLCAAGDGRRARHLFSGVTTGLAFVCGLAVLSRLHPQWFPDNVASVFLPDIEIERRLNYPLGYSSAVGVMAAMALPLLLGATAGAKSIVAQALSASLLPLAGFTIILASSGTGTGAAAVAIVAFFILSPDRLPKVGTLLAGGAGTAILAAGLADRGALDRGLPTPLAIDQGSEMIAIAIVVCAGVALVQAGISFAVRYTARPRVLTVSRRTTAIAAVAAVAVIAVVGVAAGGPGQLSDAWHSFKSRGTGVDQTDRGAVLLDTSSSGRYQFWQSAMRAGESDSLQGIGPGTFEFWWAKDPKNFGFTKDAHSLYFENFGELGWPGALLITGLMLAALILGAWRSFTSPLSPRTRIAAATATVATFAAGAAFEFFWEIAALPAIALLLFAVLATDTNEDEARAILSRRRRVRDAKAPPSLAGVWAPRVAFAMAALVAVYWIVMPLRSERDVRDSRIAVASADLQEALDKARAAADVQPDAATPLIQQALVLERMGKFSDGADMAREATKVEAVNWRNWATLARLEARAGDTKAALRALNIAEHLNPRTPGVKPS